VPIPPSFRLLLLSTQLQHNLQSFQIPKQLRKQTSYPFLFETHLLTLLVEVSKTHKSWYLWQPVPLIMSCNCAHNCPHSDLDHDYPNPTTHCNCGAGLDWLGWPQCDCQPQEFDMFFDCIEEPDCILCALWYLGLKEILPRYLNIRSNSVWPTPVSKPRSKLQSKLSKETSNQSISTHNQTHPDPFP
jgi:hypothetical protein